MGSVVPSLVADWGVRAPSSVAVSGAGGVLSYGELVGRADSLARSLVARGVRRGEVVGVCLGRDVDLVVALLGVMRAGCAYLPLDPGHPGGRSRFMVEDAGVRFVVADDAVGSELSPVAELVGFSGAGAGAGDVVLPEVGAGDLAYVIYTSGSTGTPKGVAVAHGSVARLFDRVGEWIDWSEADVWSCYHSAAFDFSVWEIWGALSAGGRVELVSYADSRDPVAFRRLLGERGVTLASLTPSALLRLMPQAAGGGLPGGLRHVVLGGEAVRGGQIAGLLELPVSERPRVWNLYGITETTVHASVRELTAADVGSGVSPIGVPLSDLTFAVVDADTGEVAGGSEVDPVPAGQTGELWISGAGVARGYVNRPELTARRFVDAVVSGVPGRWYRTGDEVRKTTEYEYVGRLDRQVQLRGFRIELSEVEAALAAREGVGAAVVELVEGIDGPELAAFVTLSGESEGGGAVGSSEDVREWLSGRLPEHMLPSSISVIDSVPVTVNGKLDRVALREMEAQPLPLRGGGDAPATDTERLLARIWSEVLGTGPIKRDDHFFTIGGNSMLALRVSMAAEENGLALGVRDLFMHPVLAELAVATPPTAPLADGPPAAAQPVPGAADAGERSYPALLVQTGMLFESERDPDRPTYHVVSETTLDASGLSRSALAAALSVVTDAQPGLRTEFDLTGADGPVQLVHGLPDPLLEYEDLSSLAPDTAEKRIEHIRESERARPFHRDDFPLWRVTCAVLPGGRARMFLSHHHALLDGWSVTVFFDQLRAALSGASVAAPTEVCMLAAEAEAQALASDDSAAYWSGMTRQWQALAVPSRQREDGEPAAWSVTYSIDEALRQDIGRACAAWRCSPKQLFLAAHLRAIESAAGPDAPRPGTLAVANARPEASDTHLAMGVFLNAVPVLPATQDASWPDRIAQVAEAELEMLEHRHFPFAAMRSRFGLPAPTTWFTYTDFAETSMADFIATVTDHTVTELPLTVSVVDDGLVVDGSSDHFTAAEVAEIVDRYVECLREAVGAASTW